MAVSAKERIASLRGKGKGETKKPQTENEESEWEEESEDETEGGDKVEENVETQEWRENQIDGDGKGWTQEQESLSQAPIPLGQTKFLDPPSESDLSQQFPTISQDISEAMADFQEAAVTEEEKNEDEMKL